MIVTKLASMHGFKKVKSKLSDTSIAWLVVYFEAEVAVTVTV